MKKNIKILRFKTECRGRRGEGRIKKVQNGVQGRGVRIKKVQNGVQGRIKKVQNGVQGREVRINKVQIGVQGRGAEN